MKVLIADKLSEQAVGDLKSLGAHVVVKPELTADDLPGVGTFYDFQDRLLQRPRQGRTTRRRPYRHRDQRDHASQHRLLQTHTAVATAGSSFSSWLPCASTLTPGSSTS